jgi:aerobic carbon-monoxide dehydrogenase small subunit
VTPPTPVVPQAAASYTLTVNGATRDVSEAWLGESLLYVLRERLGLPGAKNACEQGECGSCSVMLGARPGSVDEVDRLVCSCLVLAAAAVDRPVVTVESLADDGVLSDVQQAFVDAGAVQCGFCTPGLVMAVHDLLDRTPAPDDLAVREAISGNLCRCTGYGRIVEAVRVAVRRRTEAPT